MLKKAKSIPNMREAEDTSYGLPVFVIKKNLRIAMLPAKRLETGNW